MTANATPQLPEQRWARAYRREMLAMLLGYGAVLVASIVLVDRTTGALRYAVALAPMLPFAALPWIIVRGLRRVDEREREMSYRTFTFGFFGTAIVTFAYGFLELAGAPKLSMFVVWPLMGVLWIIGGAVAPRLP